MVKIDIISGFLGSGKTTFIKRMTKLWNPENGQLAIIENDFGSINLDAAYLSISGIQVTELNSGCVCCSLTGKLSDALSEILKYIHPSHIILEPSGVARLSDILKTIEKLQSYLPVTVGSVITLAIPFRHPAQRTRFFGVYKNQLLYANLILPGHLDLMPPDEQQHFLQTLKNDAEDVPVWNVPWTESDINLLLSLSCRKEDKYESIQFDDILLIKNKKIRVVNHTDSFDSLTLNTENIFSPKAIRFFMESIINNPEKYGTILRAKGFIKTKEGKLIKIDLNSMNIIMKEIFLSDDDSFISSVQKQIVLIGSPLYRDAIRELFHNIK